VIFSKTTDEFRTPRRKSPLHQLLYNIPSEPFFPEREYLPFINERDRLGRLIKKDVSPIQKETFNRSDIKRYSVRNLTNKNSNENTEDKSPRGGKSPRNVLQSNMANSHASSSPPRSRILIKRPEIPNNQINERLKTVMSLLDGHEDENKSVEFQYKHGKKIKLAWSRSPDDSGRRDNSFKNAFAESRLHKNFSPPPLGYYDVNYGPVQPRCLSARIPAEIDPAKLEEIELRKTIETEAKRLKKQKIIEATRVPVHKGDKVMGSRGLKTRMRGLQDMVEKILREIGSDKDTSEDEFIKKIRKEHDTMWEIIKTHKKFQQKLQIPKSDVEILRERFEMMKKKFNSDDTLDKK
jgi:hypothetical protein